MQKKTPVTSNTANNTLKNNTTNTNITTEVNEENNTNDKPNTAQKDDSASQPNNNMPEETRKRYAARQKAAEDGIPMYEYAHSPELVEKYQAMV